jgi:formylglycine-generating enzyme required for sulfatase activity
MKNLRRFHFKRWLAIGTGMSMSLMGLWAAACSSVAASQASGSDTGAAPDGGLGDAPLADGPSNGCPSGRGPAMVRVTGPGGVPLCIDSTEVTQSQYAAFIAADVRTSSQPDICMGNTSFAPSSEYPDAASSCHLDPATRGQNAVSCVDWCDAVAFCSWSGKRLCGTPANSTYPCFNTAGAPDISFSCDEWYAACSGGGQQAYFYSDAGVPGACVDVTTVNAQSDPTPLAVHSRQTCQSSEPQYAGIFDLLGNAREWSNECRAEPNDGGVTCLVVGGGLYDPPLPCDPNDPTSPIAAQVTDYWLLPRNRQQVDIGFRCCANP